MVTLDLLEVKTQQTKTPNMHLWATAPTESATPPLPCSATCTAHQARHTSSKSDATIDAWDKERGTSCCHLTTNIPLRDNFLLSAIQLALPFNSPLCGNFGKIQSKVYVIWIRDHSSNGLLTTFLIHWGLEYRTLEYKTHWNTECFKVWFSNGQNTRWPPFYSVFQ